jgi:homospermidine synthase
MHSKSVGQANQRYTQRLRDARMEISDGEKMFNFREKIQEQVIEKVLVPLISEGQELCVDLSCFREVNDETGIGYIIIAVKPAEH